MVWERQLNMLKPIEHDTTMNTDCKSSKGKLLTIWYGLTLFCRRSAPGQPKAMNSYRHLHVGLQQTTLHYLWIIIFRTLP